jgi:hypothetical protein
MTGTSCKFCGAEALVPTSKYDMPTWQCGTHSVFGKLKRSSGCKQRALQQIVNELVKASAWWTDGQLAVMVPDQLWKRIEDEVDDSSSS